MPQLVVWQAELRPKIPDLNVRHEVKIALFQNSKPEYQKKEYQNQETRKTRTKSGTKKQHREQDDTTDQRETKAIYTPGNKTIGNSIHRKQN